MQLTKAEVADSQLLVCTPEKYDVVTRKGGDQSLGTLVSLVIIDEVHLLADERGAVIETIVARTQRYVESSQKLVSSSNSSSSGGGSYGSSSVCSSRNSGNVCSWGVGLVSLVL